MRSEECAGLNGRRGGDDPVKGAEEIAACVEEIPPMIEVARFADVERGDLGIERDLDGRLYLRGKVFAEVGHGRGWDVVRLWPGAFCKMLR